MGCKDRFLVALIASLAMLIPQAALAQQSPTASIAEMANTPLVRVNIAESLRSPPDEASITVGTQAKATTPSVAVVALASVPTVMRA